MRRRNIGDGELPSRRDLAYSVLCRDANQLLIQSARTGTSEFISRFNCIILWSRRDHGAAAGSFFSSRPGLLSSAGPSGDEPPTNLKIKVRIIRAYQCQVTAIMVGAKTRSLWQARITRRCSRRAATGVFDDGKRAPTGGRGGGDGGARRQGARANRRSPAGRDFECCRES